MASVVEDMSETFEKEKFTTKSYDASEHIMETFLLDGKYSIKLEYLNEVAAAMDKIDYDDFEEVENCKSVYFCGNILYKTNEPKVWDYINLIIKATYTKELPVNVDRSVKNREQKIGGTICPTRDVIFAYDGKLFVLYGRYIYGYDQRYVRFVNEKPKIVNQNCDDDDDEEEDYEDNDCGYYRTDLTLPPSLSNKEVILPIVPYETKIKLKLRLDDYIYGFAVIDIASNVLIAFALYR